MKFIQGLLSNYDKFLDISGLQISSITHLAVIYLDNIEI